MKAFLAKSVIVKLVWNMVRIIPIIVAEEEGKVIWNSLCSGIRKCNCVHKIFPTRPENTPRTHMSRNCNDVMVFHLTEKNIAKLFSAVLIPILFWFSLLSISSLIYNVKKQVLIVIPLSQYSTHCNCVFSWYHAVPDQMQLLASKYLCVRPNNRRPSGRPLHHPWGNPVHVCVPVISPAALNN